MLVISKILFPGSCGNVAEHFELAGQTVHRYPDIQERFAALDDFRIVEWRHHPANPISFAIAARPFSAEPSITSNAVFRLMHFAAEQNHIFDKVFHPESADGKCAQGKNLIPGFLHRRAGLGAELSHRPPML